MRLTSDNVEIACWKDLRSLQVKRQASLLRSCQEAVSTVFIQLWNTKSPCCICIRHEDGSVRFWDVSSAGIRLLYKLTTADMFGGYYRGDMSDIDADEEWPPFRKVTFEFFFTWFYCWSSTIHRPLKDPLDSKLMLQKQEFSSCPANSVLNEFWPYLVIRMWFLYFILLILILCL